MQQAAGPTLLRASRTTPMPDKKATSTEASAIQEIGKIGQNPCDKVGKSEERMVQLLANERSRWHNALDDMKRDLSRQQELQMELLRRDLVGACTQGDGEVGGDSSDFVRLRHDLDTSQSVQATQGAYFRVDLEQQKAKVSAVEAMLLEMRRELTDLHREREQQASQMEAMLKDVRSDVDAVQGDAQAQKKAVEEINVIHEAMMQGASDVTRVMQEVSQSLSISEEKMRHEIEDARRSLEAATAQRCQVILQAFDTSAQHLAKSIVEEREERQREASMLKAAVEAVKNSCDDRKLPEEAEIRNRQLAGASGEPDTILQNSLLPLMQRLDALQEALSQVAKISDVKCVETDLQSTKHSLEALTRRVDQEEACGHAAVPETIRFRTDSVCSFTGNLPSGPTTAAHSPRGASRSSSRPMRPQTRSLEPPPRRVPAPEENFYSTLSALVKKMDEVLVKPRGVQTTCSTGAVRDLGEVHTQNRSLPQEDCLQACAAPSRDMSRSSSKDRGCFPEMQNTSLLLSPQDCRRSPGLRHANTQFQMLPPSASRSRVLSPQPVQSQASRQMSGNLAAKHNTVIFAPSPPHGVSTIAASSVGIGRPHAKADASSLSMHRMRS